MTVQPNKKRVVVSYGSFSVGGRRRRGRRGRRPGLGRGGSIPMTPARAHTQPLEAPKLWILGDPTAAARFWAVCNALSPSISISTSISTSPNCVDPECRGAQATDNAFCQAAAQPAQVPHPEAEHHDLRDLRPQQAATPPMQELHQDPHQYREGAAQGACSASRIDPTDGPADSSSPPRPPPCLL